MKAIYQKGFSLVELLVVITIIAILSVVAYTAVGGQTVKARDSKRLQDLSSIQNALEIYANEFGSYPAALVNGSNPGQIPRRILSTIPVDPAPGNSTYLYAYDATTNTYQIATTLEGNGSPADYSARVVGNSDLNLFSTNGTNTGFWYNPGNTPSLISVCTTAGLSIQTAPIATTDINSGTGCVPYDPRN